VRLRRGEEEVDLVEAIAEVERPIKAALVRDQHRVGDALAALDRGEHLLRIRQLGDDVGVNE
jgi:hypothetical protein